MWGKLVNGFVYVAPQVSGGGSGGTGEDRGGKAANIQSMKSTNRDEKFTLTLFCKTAGSNWVRSDASQTFPKTKVPYDCSSVTVLTAGYVWPDI